MDEEKKPVLVHNCKDSTTELRKEITQILDRTEQNRLKDSLPSFFCLSLSLKRVATMLLMLEHRCGAVGSGTSWDANVHSDEGFNK